MNNITSVKIAQGGWQVIHDGGQSTFVPTNHRYAQDVQAWIKAGNTPTPEVTLTEAQTDQLSKINQSCADAIQSGVSVTFSDGTTHTLTLSATDQRNALMAATVVQKAMMSAKSWAASTVYSQDDFVLDSGNYYIAMTGGTSGSTAPTFPTAFDTQVTDGTVKWALFGILSGTDKGNVRLNAQDVLKAFSKGTTWVDACRKQYDTLKAQINAATTVSAVQAITWTNPTI